MHTKRKLVSNIRFSHTNIDCIEQDLSQRRSMKVIPFPTRKTAWHGRRGQKNGDTKQKIWKA